jgi:hypothetical protein
MLIGRGKASPYCWYGTSASPMRTRLFCAPTPVTSNAALTNLPFWSTLIPELVLDSS